MLMPAQTTLEAWTDVEAARAWVGLSAEAWKRLASELGDPELSSLLLLAGMSELDFMSAVEALNPPYTMLQKTAAKLMFNAVKGKFGIASSMLNEPKKTDPAFTGLGAPGSLNGHYAQSTSIQHHRSIQGHRRTVDSDGQVEGAEEKLFGGCRG